MRKGPAAVPLRCVLESTRAGSGSEPKEGEAGEEEEEEGSRRTADWLLPPQIDEGTVTQPSDGEEPSASPRDASK